jgi:hypothetical protein
MVVGTGRAQSVQRGATGWMDEVQFQAGQEIFLFSTVSRSALGPSQPPI